MRVEHKGERRPSALPNFDDCLSADRPRLRRMARDLLRPPRADERAAAQRLRLQADFEALLERSRAALLARRAALPVPDFPPELPVSARRDEIAEALAAHQVIIVCGANKAKMRAIMRGPTKPKRIHEG